MFLKCAIVVVSILVISKAQIPAYDEEVCIDQDDGALFQAENSCTEYYYCENGVGYLEDCLSYGEEFQFNPEINDCDYGDVVNCVLDNVAPPVTQAPQTQAPQTQAPQTQAPQTQAPQTQAPTEAPIQTTTSVITDPNLIPDVECPTNLPGEIIFLPSANCSEYYICANGVKLTMRCVEGFVWIPEENQCDHPIYNPRCSELAFDGVNVRCRRHGFYNAPYPADCTKFVFCAEGVPMVQNCPIGTAWQNDRCVSRQYAMCPDASRLRLQTF